MALPTDTPALPVGAWDCHAHIYGPFARFPLPEGAAYHPDEAPFTALAALHEHLGIGHGVLVQAAPYGTDHSAILAAIAASGGRYRGIALLDASVGDTDLQALHDGGIRGVRFNLMGHLPGARDPALLRDLARRVARFGWHVLLHGETAPVLAMLEELAVVDVPVVIDHMARPDLTSSDGAAETAALAAVLKRPDRWIKLSGVDRAMGGAAGPWHGAVDHVRRLLEMAPDRAIWGTDWPHPNVRGATPDDTELLRFALSVCGSDEAAHALFVDNPARLYTGHAVSAPHPEGLCS